MTPERYAAIREILYHPTVDHSDVQQAPISVRDADELLAEVDALRSKHQTLKLLYGDLCEALRKQSYAFSEIGRKRDAELKELRAKLAGACRVEHEWVDYGSITNCYHCGKPRPAGEGGGDGE